MKKKLAILGLLAALLLLMGCASSRANVPYRVYLITKSTQTEFWKSVFAGAYAAKSEYNIDLTILGPETEEEFEIQNQYIAQAIANHADAIVFSAISYTKNAPAIDAAISAGIKVVVIDSDVDSDGVSARIGTDNVEAGRISAAAALDAEPDDLVVGIINCYAETQNCQERAQGFREVLSSSSRVKEIYTVNTSTDAELAKQAAIQLLQEHPEINVLIGFNEPLAVGTARAVEELGLAGQVRAIAFDSNVECIELLQSDVVSALIVQNPYAMGYLGVEKAWETLQGKDFDAAAPIDTATLTITKVNLFSKESQKALFSFS